MELLTEVHGSFTCWIGDVSTRSIINVPSLSLSYSNTFVQGFNVTKVEKRAVVQCFGHSYHVYAFGPDPEASNFSVTFGVFFQTYKNCESFSASSAVTELLEAYEEMKVSKNPAMITMNVDDGGSVSGILTGLQINSIDPTYNLVSVTLLFTDINPE